LVPLQQSRHLHLRQPVLAHQSLHQPRLLQLAGPPSCAVEPEDQSLGLPLVHLQHAHAQARPGHTGRRRAPLEAVEQLQTPLPPAAATLRPPPPPPRPAPPPAPPAARTPQAPGPPPPPPPGPPAGSADTARPGRSPPRRAPQAPARPRGSRASLDPPSPGSL